jgi:AraC-like DNA-binding protein
MAPGLAPIDAHQALPVGHAASDRAGVFLSQVASAAGCELLFEYLSDVSFFMKDRDGRFTRANREFVRRVGASAEAGVIGARDSDFFPPNLAEAYTRDDHAVMSSGQPIVDKAELVPGGNGGVDWCCTTKLPLVDGLGRVIGLCGITRDMKSRMHVAEGTSATWTQMIEVMLNDYPKAIEMSDLAQRVGLSVSQFNREFRKRFLTTPYAYLSNIRLDAACHLLVESELSMAQIALRTGFYDQSHFTNRFVRHRGMPPSRYRALHARPNVGRARELLRRSVRLISNETNEEYISR